MGQAFEKGFSLIELMVVVAIVGTLAAIAIPAYQNYTIRAQISEGLTLAATSQTAVEEYYSENGRWPDSNDEAGLPGEGEIQGKYTGQVSVIAGGFIEITYDNYAHQFIQNRIVTLAATDTLGSVRWDCNSDGNIRNKHLPSSCRTSASESGGEEEKKDKKDKKGSK